jgi:hypothetical protein
MPLKERYMLVANIAKVIRPKSGSTVRVHTQRKERLIAARVKNIKTKCYE